MSSFRANPYLPTRSSKIWGWGGSLVACLMSDHPGVATSLLLVSTGHSHPRGSEVRRVRPWYIRTAYSNTSPRPAGLRLCWPAGARLRGLNRSIEFRAAG